MFVNCFCPTPVHQKSDDKCGPKLPPLHLFCIQDNILFCANLQANINWIPSECRFQLRGSAGFSGWHFVSGYTYIWNEWLDSDVWRWPRTITHLTHSLSFCYNKRESYLSRLLLFFISLSGEKLPPSISLNSFLRNWKLKLKGKGTKETFW